MSQYGGVPERFKQEGIKVSGNSLARIGDFVEAISFVGGLVPRGTRSKILDILVEPNQNVRGFTKRIEIAAYPGQYLPPQRFKRIESTGINNS